MPSKRPLKPSTICKMLTKRGWVNDSNGIITFFYPNHGAYSQPVGALGIPIIVNPVLIWSDARLKRLQHIHLVGYYLWPTSKQACLEIIQEIEGLVKEYC